MSKFRHGPSFDLADALAREIEVFADLFEGARLAAVEAKAQLQDLALTLVEWSKEAVDFVGQQRGCGSLERRFGTTILDHVAEFGITVLTKRL